MSYVYLMQSGKRYKIGKADDPEERLETFKTADPEIRLLTAVSSRDSYALEARLHRYFAAKRIWQDREWFNLTPQDVRLIMRLEERPRALGWAANWRRFSRTVTIIYYLLVIMLALTWVENSLPRQKVIPKPRPAPTLIRK